ncbi:MAG: ABC-F family ATP-binding cassette domain-containing protein [Phycisphaerae bacterium]
MSKQFGGQVVLRGLSLELTSGEVVGIIGPNGCGKTTLMRLILGQTEPDSGTVTCSRGLDVGYLSQEPDLADDRTLHDEVLSAFSELLGIERRMRELSDEMTHRHERPDELRALMDEYDRLNARFLAAGGYTYEQRLAEIVSGLGFREEDKSLPVRVLSGGQKCRAALAKLLLRESTYLLLDEPTNHLDIDAVRWLEKFLAGHTGGAAIISHDRYLLDRVAQRIVALEGGQAHSYPGNYSNYAQTLERDRLTQERQHEKDRAYIAKEREYVARYGAGQRARQARGRQTRLERQLEDGRFVLDAPAQRRRIDFEFNVEVPEGRTIIELDGLAKSYSDRRLFADLSLVVRSQDRIGITGPNGVGKSTLLRILVGQQDADAGGVRIHSAARLGYFAQESRELNPDWSVLQAVLDARPEFTEQRARSILGAFLFSGEDVFKKIPQLSGGEQSRVRIVRLMLASPSVLVLDEPTNHLDIPSREALEAALLDYPGAIIAVSHDRYFLDRIATRLLVMRPAGHRLIQGNYSAYIQRAESEAAAAAAKAQSDKRATAPSASKHAAPRSRLAGLKLAEIEARMDDVRGKIQRCHEQFADPLVYKDGARVAELRAELEACETQQAELEAAWYERAARELE